VEKEGEGPGRRVRARFGGRILLQSRLELRGVGHNEFPLYLIYIKGRQLKRERDGGRVRYILVAEVFLAEEGAWWREPYLGVRQADGHFYLSGFACFLGSGD